MGRVPHTVQRDDADRGTGLTRRSFLALAGAGGAAVGVSALGNRYAFATPAQPDTGDVIVIVFNRGGMDALNVVAPFRMPSYAALRPTIRVKAPEEVADPATAAGLPLVAGGAVPGFARSGVFALHPGMESLHQGAWAAGHLAIVHAAGMPASETTTRSHFESQRNWEAGSASLAVSDGFLNRYLAGVGDLDRLGAIGRGSTLQAMLRGGAAAYSMASISGFGVRGYSDNARARTALLSMYDGGADVVSATGVETLSVTGLVESLPAGSRTGQRGQLRLGRPGQGPARGRARLIKADVGLRRRGRR